MTDHQILVLLEEILSPIPGLLGTITKTAETTNCPGKCIHALASLLCDEVREDIQCPQDGLRCCVDRRRLKPSEAVQEKSDSIPIDEVSAASDEQTTENTTATSKPKAKKKTSTTERNSDAIPASMKSVIQCCYFFHKCHSFFFLLWKWKLIQNEPQSSDKADKFGDGDVDYEYTNDNSDGSSSGSNSSLLDEWHCLIWIQKKRSHFHHLENCPGVCVAERLSSFCEAILDVEGVCKPELKCCVSKQIFQGKPTSGG